MISLLATNRRKRKRRPDPLRLDPTRTATLRRAFEEEVNRKITLISHSVNKLLLHEDAFGLKKSNRPILTNTRWRFLTSDKKVEQFNRWLSSQFDDKVLDMSLPPDQRYYDAYIKQGFKKGAGRAFSDTKKKPIDKNKLQWYKGTQDEFLRSAFARPETIGKLQMLTSRVFTDLQGFSNQMATTLTRELSDGLVRGDNPLTISKRMRESLDISRWRAETIARTEIVRAHSEGQLHALESLNVSEVNVMVEWSTSGDDRVCPSCDALSGVTIKVEDAHGMIPRHPNCRCAWIPANVGEAQSGQKRSRAQVKKAIDKSVKAEGPGTLAQRKKKSKWAGADHKPVKPFKSLVDPLEEETLFATAPSLLARGTPEQIKQYEDMIKLRNKVNKKAKLPNATDADREMVKKVAKDLADLREVIRNQPVINPQYLTPAEAKKLGYATPTPKPVPTPSAPAGSISQLTAALEQEYGIKVSLSKPVPSSPNSASFYTKTYEDALAEISAQMKNMESLGMEDLTAFIQEQQHLGITLHPLANLPDVYGTPASYTNLASRMDFTTMGAPIDHSLLPKFGEWNTVSDLGGTYRHEFAHHYWFQGMSAQQRKEFELIAKKYVGNSTISVSNYGQTSAKELFAETFAAYTHPKYASLANKLPQDLEEYLAKALGNKAATKTATKAVTTLPTSAPKPFKLLPSGVPAHEDIKVISTLSGSTKPKLVVDPTGKKWVMKDQLAAGHAKSEVMADDFYRAMGIDVPKSALVPGPDGKLVKMSEYIEDGEALGKWWKTATTAQQNAMKAELQKHFVVDAWMGNWDVVGLSMDNILVVNGKPYRIDNGGALLYRAQGKKKTGWGANVTELDTLRDANKNAQTATMFKDVTDTDILNQIEALDKKKIFNAMNTLDDETRKVMQQRLSYLNGWAEQQQKAIKQLAKEAAAKAKAAAASVAKKAADELTKPTLIGSSLSDAQWSLAKKSQKKEIISKSKMIEDLDKEQDKIFKEINSLKGVSGTKAQQKALQQQIAKMEKLADELDGDLHDIIDTIADEVGNPTVSVGKGKSVPDKKWNTPKPVIKPGPSTAVDKVDTYAGDFGTMSARRIAGDKTPGEYTPIVMDTTERTASSALSRRQERAAALTAKELGPELERTVRTMTKAEIQAVKSFTGHASKEINKTALEITKAQRTGKTLSSSVYNSSKVRDLDAALEKLPGYTGITTRGVGGMSAKAQEEWANWTSGKWSTVRWDAFSSTTLKPDKTFHGDLVFIIKNKGHQGALVPTLSSVSTEWEVLYKRNSRFRVTGYYESVSREHIKGLAPAGKKLKRKRVLVIEETDVDFPASQAAPTELSLEEVEKLVKQSRSEYTKGKFKTVPRDTPELKKAYSIGQAISS